MSISSDWFPLIKFIGIVPPLLIAIVIHEMAHGWAADKLGDPTARQLGRITFNPIKHVDPVMTILTPAILFLIGSPFIFGGAKPVPVNPMNFENPRRGMAWVALAGPVSNFILATIHVILAKLYLVSAPLLIQNISPWILIITAIWISQGFLINVVLGIFNLFPIPPLDGGRIAVGFLPIPIAKKIAGLERFGIAIVFALLLTGVMDSYLNPILSFADKIMRTVGF